MSESGSSATSRRWSDFTIAAFSGTIAGAVYVATLLRCVGGTGDSAKFQFVGWVLGTPHATGYPLWVLLSHAFTRGVPIGTVAWRANLLSAVLAAATVSVLVLVLRRGVGLGIGSSVAAAWLFAVGPTWWSQAVIAEVYTLHALLLVTVWALLLWWQRSASSIALAAASVALGLSFANHATTVTVLPAIVLFLAMERKHLRWRHLWCGLIVVVIPGMLYLYPVWRTHDPTATYLEMQTPDLESLWWFLSGAQFRDRMFAFGVTELVTERLPMFFGLLLRQVSVVGVVLAAVGLWMMRGRRALVVMLVAFLGPAAYALGYDIPSIEVYFIPCWLVVSVAVALGAERLAGRLGTRGPAVAAVALLALAVGLAAINWERVDRSDHRAERVWAESVVADLPTEAVVVADRYIEYEVLQYFHQTGNTGGRRLWIMTPLVGPEDRVLIDTLLDRYEPPPTIRRHWLEAAGPETIKRYIERGTPLWLGAERREVPPGLPVFVTGQTQCDLLRGIGLEADRVGPSLWRVFAAPGLVSEGHGNEE